MDIVNDRINIINDRINRVDMDNTKYYIQVKYVDGIETRTYVGKFIRTYYRGSGDGTTVHIEFENNGIRTSINEDMWGSMNGKELSYFIEKV